MIKLRRLYNLLTTVFALAALMSLGMIPTLGVVRSLVNFTVFALLTRDYYLKEMSVRHQIRREKRAVARREKLTVERSARDLDVFSA
jgi:hypothetical protein